MLIVVIKVIKELTTKTNNIYFMFMGYLYKIHEMIFITDTETITLTNQQVELISYFSVDV